MVEAHLAPGVHACRRAGLSRTADVAVLATLPLQSVRGFHIHSKWLSLALALAFLCSGCITVPQCRPLEVTTGIYGGCKPTSQADFLALRQQGIRTIISFETLPWHVRGERRRARLYGLHFVHVGLIASPFEPSEARVKAAVLALHDESLRPVYLHCYLGEDRVAFVAGLYRIYYEHWPPQAAWNQMLRWGFHSTPRLRGLTTYFWSHTEIPDWAREPEHGVAWER